MNVVEAVLSTFLVALMVVGMMYAVTQSLHGRDAQQAVAHVRVYQDALIRHQRENPQDGVENWFPAQCPATHAGASVDAPRLNGGGCEELASGTPPTCPAGQTLVADRVLASPTSSGTPPAFSCPAGHALIPAVPPATEPTCRVSTCRMTTIPTTGCPAGHTLVSGSMPACELDAPWTELTALDDPATPYHDGEMNLQKLDLHNLVEFSLSTQLHAGADVPTPYGGAYRVLSNGASPYLRIEFDVTGFEPAAYLVAQNVYPGLRSEIDPLPLANVHDENTTYVAAVHLRPGYARTIHAYVVDPVEIGNPGSGFGNPIKFVHPQYRGDGGAVGFGGETHRAGARCDIFRDGVAGASVTDAEGMFLTCRDDPRGIVLAGPIWVRSSDFEAPLVDVQPVPCPTCPPPAHATSTRICPGTPGVTQDLTRDCDSFSSLVSVPSDHWQPWLGSGSDKICYCGITPVPPLPPPPGQCGMSIVQSGSNVTVQFYETAVGGARTDGPPVTKTLPQHFGLLPTDLPSSDRMDAGIQAYLDAHPHFNAWVSALEGQAAQVAGACFNPGLPYSCGLEYTRRSATNWDLTFITHTPVVPFTIIDRGPTYGLIRPWDTTTQIIGASRWFWEHVLAFRLTAVPEDAEWLMSPIGQTAYNSVCIAAPPPFPPCDTVVLTAAIDAGTGMCYGGVNGILAVDYYADTFVTTSASTYLPDPPGTPGVIEEWWGNPQSSDAICRGGSMPAIDSYVVAPLMPLGYTQVPACTEVRSPPFGDPTLIRGNVDLYYCSDCYR